MSFLGGSGSEDSACNAGDFGSIPGWEASSGEGIGYPLQYSWYSLMFRRCKKKKIRLQCGRPGFDPWVGKIRWREEGTTTHSSILPWRIPTDRGAWRATVHGVAKSRTRLSD